MKEIIEKYISEIADDEFHRFKSWDHCFSAFSSSEQNDNHALELAFYLASWGMYRGSSGLLQKNHLVHRVAVNIIYKKHKLKCHKGREVSPDDIKEILAVKKKLANHYSSKKFNRGAEDPKPISPTDTLISKIMLGTLGCVPAYDRYFIMGMKEKGLMHFDFSKESLTELFGFIEKNGAAIEAAQQLIKTKLKRHYPIMKIVDMYFWQVGYDK